MELNGPCYGSLARNAASYVAGTSSCVGGWSRGKGSLVDLIALQLPEFDGIDLILMGSQFAQADAETFNPALQQNFADAGAKLVESGLSRMR